MKERVHNVGQPRAIVETEQKHRAPSYLAIVECAMSATTLVRILREIQRDAGGRVAPL